MTIEELAEKVDDMGVELKAQSVMLIAMNAVIEHIQKLIVDEVL